MDSNDYNLCQEDKQLLVLLNQHLQETNGVVMAVLKTWITYNNWDVMNADAEFMHEAQEAINEAYQCVLEVAKEAPSAITLDDSSKKIATAWSLLRFIREEQATLDEEDDE